MHLIEHRCVKVGRYIIPLVGHEYMKARNENKFIITGEDASNQQQRYNKLMRNEMHRIEHIQLCTSKTYWHDPSNIVLNGDKNAFSSMPPIPSVALLMTVPIAREVQSTVFCTQLLPFRSAEEVEKLFFVKNLKLECNFPMQQSRQ